MVYAVVVCSAESGEPEVGGVILTSAARRWERCTF